MGDHTLVCYAREDKDFVLKLCSNLESRGARIWVDRKISIGANWENAVEQAIRDCASFLVVLSPAMVASAQARGELSMALDLQKPIVPIHYRACELPHRLRAIQFLDCESASPDDEAVLGNILQALGVTSAVEPPASPTEPPWSAFLGQGAESELTYYPPNFIAGPTSETTFVSSFPGVNAACTSVWLVRSVRNMSSGRA